MVSEPTLATLNRSPRRPRFAYHRCLSLRITFTSISLVETRGRAARKSSARIVQDTKGDPLSGLTKGDFPVCDKGKRQETSEI